MQWVSLTSLVFGGVKLAEKHAVYAALAQISGGRYLIVFFINKKRGMALPISARDMDPAEREYYGGHK
jgi:uncharacterized DUF497 family protein